MPGKCSSNVCQCQLVKMTSKLSHDNLKNVHYRPSCHSLDKTVNCLLVLENYLSANDKNFSSLKNEDEARERRRERRTY